MSGNFPALVAALGKPSKYGWFPGHICCYDCGEGPCVCCPVCGEVFWPWLCTHGELVDQPQPAPAPDKAVIEAMRVLTEHGITAEQYEELSRGKAS